MEITTDDKNATDAQASDSVLISKVMKQSFLDYSMSVITDRALPDARDGLKPVHRRILYAMKIAGNVSGRPYRKSARTVGDVIGKFHPHGDASVYMAAVRMAQDFSMRVPLIDGQGNFGSIDDDPPAAMRYTEMRLSKIATEHFFSELNSNGVDYQPNYDDTEKEPVVLPVAFPNLVVNGVEGIAVGMASSILPHNLTETISLTRALLKNPQMDSSQMAAIMPGPDFPTGGVIIDRSGYVEALETGRGRVRARATWTTEKGPKGSTAVVIDSLPYQTIKTRLIEQIVTLVKNKEIEDISDLRDESNKEGVRIYIQLKRGADPHVLMANLFAKTDLEKSYTYNCVALDGGIRPKQMGIKALILSWIAFRREVVIRRLEHERGQLEKRLHILEGLLKALDNLDEVVNTIRSSKDKEEARVALEALLDIDDVQAKAILDMRLHQLTSLEHDELRMEHDKAKARISEINEILSDQGKMDQIIDQELSNIQVKYGDERRTKIDESQSGVNVKDLIPNEPCVVVATRRGYVKRISQNDLKRQGRGTRGRRMIDLGEDDYVSMMRSAMTHDSLLVITDSGQVYQVPVYQLPDSGAKGRHIRNIVEMEGEIVSATLIPEDADQEKAAVTIATESGLIKRTALKEYQGAKRKSGIIGIKLREGDRIIGAGITCDGDEVMLVDSNGNAIRFDAYQVRMTGRASAGVVGMRSTGRVISMILLSEKEQKDVFLMTLSEKGYGKRTRIEEFPKKNRGGKGVVAFKESVKTGEIVYAMKVAEDEDVVLLADNGVSNRVHVATVRPLGRNTSGVRIMNVDEGHKLIYATSATHEEDEAQGESEA